VDEVAEREEAALKRLVIYRCPITGMSVHGHAEVEEGAIDGTSYTQLRCSSCGRVHLINPTTGRPISDTDDFKRP
jgi:hypothetical protein